MIKFTGIICATMCAATALCAPFALKVERIYSPNLLKDPQFSQTGKNIWIFANYSKTERISCEFSDGILRINTPGNAYSYMTQPNIPVQEGKRYYVGSTRRCTSRSLMWVTTPQYHDGKNSQHPPFSDTTIFFVANPPTYKDAAKLLAQFISEKFLIDYNNWQTLGKEFVVPKGKNITFYDFRIGAYGGVPGWIEFKDPEFCEAAMEYKISFESAEPVTIQLLSAAGKIRSTRKFAGKTGTQSTIFKVSSRLEHLKIRISDGKQQFTTEL